MLQLATAAGEAAVWDSVWLGDSIIAKPRLDVMVALGGLAAVTSRVKLGVGCMASAPLRDALLMAYQWASFDFMCGGRSIYVACQGQREAGGGNHHRRDDSETKTEPPGQQQKDRKDQIELFFNR